MLLRRVIENVKHQNWTAVAIDLVIVFVGVFLGLQAQEWGSARAQRTEEISYLRALKADVEASTTHVQEYIGFLEEQAESQRMLARLSDGEPLGLPVEEIDAHIHRGVYELYFMRPRMVAFEDLKSAGKLSLLGSQKLREELQVLESQIAAVKDWEGDVANIYYLFSDPFLIENYPMRGVVHRQGAQFGAEYIRWIDPMENREDALPSLRTQRFLNILLYRGNIGAGLIRTAREIPATYQEIDALLDARLEHLGAAP